MKKLLLDGNSLTLDVISTFIKEKVSVALAPNAVSRIKATRKFVDEKAASDKPYYGINTGFGRLANKHIGEDNLERLQENLIISHAVGVGDGLPADIVKLMMLLRANMLAMGYSGIRLETLELLIEMINSQIIPFVPEQGSVGASGDLAPLSHLALALIGKGDAYYKGKLIPSEKALASEGLNPVVLQAKEGISLINGTQAMTAIAANVVLRAQEIIKIADIAAALSSEGYRASLKPFDERIHKLRAHPGQLSTSLNIRKLTSKSKIALSHVDCKRVQDPYSFRCVPQVHGAAKDLFAYSKGVIEREINSCTDNPLIFFEDNEILCGGNFHGEPVALAMDALSMALAELGNISERRIFLLNAPLDGDETGLFLIEDSGLSSGMMIPHVVAASLVSENKLLANPASTDSIPTSAGQEDHVSMGMHSARKALKITKNLMSIFAIELLCAVQAIDLQPEGHSPGLGTKEVYNLIRKRVPYATVDREFRYDILEIFQMLESGNIVRSAEDMVGELKI